ncbi:uncharacterized protein LOC119654986 isoform X2 [Hermetia illucens]|uniref:uncharacterized protein LOC119654986 isoform X2 n=1 Tax=Hermetia illucens TaxID=343691 RepID=UPI0018CC3D8A|nr:uncharacterized protein LOC119654986 isoform X2 [Hermetia illucens]
MRKLSLIYAYLVSSRVISVRDKTKLVYILAVLIVVVALVEAQCPLSSKVTTCSPKCVENNDCSTLGGKCCPNICNAKSCVLPNQFGGNNDKYDRGKTGATGTYCGNVKCNVSEKCQMDRTTKRMMCVRS